MLLIEYVSTLLKYCNCLSWLSGALVRVGGSDFIGHCLRLDAGEESGARPLALPVRAVRGCPGQPRASRARDTHTHTYIYIYIYMYIYIYIYTNLYIIHIYIYIIGVCC